MPLVARAASTLAATAPPDVPRMSRKGLGCPGSSSDAAFSTPTW
jgi:hypothetical protein